MTSNVPHGGVFGPPVEEEGAVVDGDSIATVVVVLGTVDVRTSLLLPHEMAIVESNRTTAVDLTCWTVIDAILTTPHGVNRTCEPLLFQFLVEERNHSLHAGLITLLGQD